MGARAGKVNGGFLGLLALFGAVAVSMALWAAKPQRDVVSSHHPSGTNLAVRPFEKARAARAWVTWYEDRWKASESFFEGGQRVGVWRQYGRPYRGTDGEGEQADLVRASFEADELHGPFVRTFPGGEGREAGNYTHGLRHGPWIRHDSPGGGDHVEHYWRGHNLGVSNEELFRSLESDPPGDRDALFGRLDSARPSEE